MVASVALGLLSCGGSSPPTSAVSPTPPGSTTASAGPAASSLRAPSPAGSTATARVDTPPAADHAIATPTIDPRNVGVPLPDDDVCEKNPDGSIKDPIPPGKYTGLLRNARCDQQKFLTMASVMKQVGASDCTFCHAPDPKNPKRALYAESTPRKAVANWMLATFVEGLQRVDGKPMTCRGCHAAEKGQGKGTVHFLREPRDVTFTQEWMNEVMTTQFLERSGKRLRCKTCHVGMAPGQTGWNRKVIRELEATGDGSIVRLAGAR